MKTYRNPPLVRGPGDEVVESILREIMVRGDVLAETKRRRNLVCELAIEHEAARAVWYSGSVAHGTANSPLGDADCGVMVDRRFDEFRAFGPDAPGGGKGPEAFIQSFADWILPRLRAAGYPKAGVDLDGNRAIKFMFNEPLEFDALGIVDPYVDLIIGLDRKNAPGVWIPNRRRQGWDAAHPQRHTEMMTTGAPEELIVHRAHLLRLSKRAVKRDGLQTDRPAVCSWNLSALGLAFIANREPIAAALSQFLAAAAASIRRGLTDDPAGVAGKIKLPDGVTREHAAERLQLMGGVVADAAEATSVGEARRLLARLFGVEIDSIRTRERAALTHPLGVAIKRRDGAAIATAVGAVAPMKRTRDHGE
jgi:hypothetical protein